MLFPVQILTEKVMNLINSMKHITSKHKAGISWFFLQSNHQKQILQSWIKLIRKFTAKHKTGQKEYFFFNL